MKLREKQRGFALPTIVLASVVLMMLLSAALSIASSNTSALRGLYYNKLAQEAGESGLAMAEACLAQNNYQAQWSTASPLRPNTSCNGGAACTGDQSCYVVSNNNVRSTFTVAAPTTDANGFQRVVVNADVAILNSVGVSYSVSSQSLTGTFGAEVTFQKVTFGYSEVSGAFFGVIDVDGNAKAVGYNAQGQLGNGTTTSAATPTSFLLPNGKRASALYTSMLSEGYAIFAVTTDGDVYGAGMNSDGQLGNGIIGAGAQTTPVKFNLPAGVTGKYINMLRTVTYVIGSDNNIYSVGACSNGQLGNNYTISGCASRATPVRVSLPSVNVSDLNTLPVAVGNWSQPTNIVTDLHSAIVRMQGGAVYGWGENGKGQLANGGTADSSVPVKIGTFGDSGSTKATQLAFDGYTLYVLDSNGDVYATGANMNGSLAGAPAGISSSTGFCLDNANNSTSTGTQIRIWTCNNSTAQRLEWQPDGTLRLHPNSSTTLCIDNKSSNTSNGNPIQTYTCNNSGAQQWQLRDDGSIYNPASGKCIDNPNNSSSSGTTVQLYTCNASAAQTWSLKPSLSLTKIPIPAASGPVTRVTTDQYAALFLTQDGKVWGAGLNTMGQLGIGTNAQNNADLTQAILPAAAKDVYTCRRSGFSGGDNSYYIMADGSVYGAGANTYGQLGIGSTATYVATPQKMLLPTGVKASSVQCGLGTAIVLSTDGKIFTVGNNSNGQLGDGTTTNRSVPIAAKYTNIIPRIVY